MMHCLWPWLLAFLLSSTKAINLHDFDWDSIMPSHNLNYTSCYQEFQCARLLVPLDWKDESNPYTVAIAIAKLPAKVSEDDPSFGGTIFTNPGGPSASGVEHVIQAGRKLQHISGGDKHYEILSWDPRGVQFTSPKVDCFSGDLKARDLFDVESKAIGSLDSSKLALHKQWARAVALGELCGQSAKNGSVLPYLTTPSVVQDMVAILDQVHALRGEGVHDVLSSKDNGNRRLELRDNKSDIPRILYWGMSYGSVLGNTFASMYPGRVGRVIVDGVADADDYMRGTWLTNLQDTEAVVDEFYRSCFEAGACTLRKSSDKEWQDLKHRVLAFISQKNEEPISLVVDNKITVITGDDILSAFTWPMYTPLQSFRRLSELLSGALEGNYTLLVSDIQNAGPKLHDSCSAPNSSTLALLGNSDAFIAIKCGDGEDERDRDLAQFNSYLQELKSQSTTFGAYWANIRLSCSGWNIRPKWRFTGPFTTPKHDAALVEGKPAAPLLIMSARLDPVTPLRNAVKMATKHTGASWVVQESSGHGALSAPSKCSQKIIQDYLQYGKLPKSGTSCPADCDPWHPCNEEAKKMTVSLFEDGGLMRHKRFGM